MWAGSPAAVRTISVPPRSRRPGFLRTGRASWSESCVLLLSLRRTQILPVNLFKQAHVGEGVVAARGEGLVTAQRTDKEGGLLTVVPGRQRLGERGGVAVVCTSLIDLYPRLRRPREERRRPDVHPALL